MDVNNPISESRPSNEPPKLTLVWEWPLRLWHWAVATSVTVALLTGLVPQLDYFSVHRIAGISVVGLIVFRFLWGLLGGTYARFNNYWTTPRALIHHFTGKAEPRAHTSPGVLLTLAVLLTLTLQSVAGLLTTDDVFYEGPLVQFADDEIVENATDLHRQGWKFIVALIAIHLSAHVVYLVFFRSRIPLSMFTGRKPTHEPDTTWSIWRAAIAFSVALVAFLILLYYSR